MPRLARLLPALLIAALALGPAAPARAWSLGGEDPLEAVNRRVHAFNETVRAQVLAPAAEFYLAHTTPGFRQGVGNVLANLREPVTALSGLAVGDTALARNAALRFGINATLGWGGVHDRAAALGHPRQAFTTADALCAWGVPAGPFLMLPLLGPSSLRDAGAMAATGAAVSQLLSPDLTFAWGTGDALQAYVEAHPAMRQVEQEALDPYAVYRSAYRQRRAAVCAVDSVEVEEAEELAAP